VVVRADGIIVRDLGSTHGTYVDGSRIAGEALVQSGATVRLGSRGPRIRIVDARIAGRSVPHDVELAPPAGGASRRVPKTVLTDEPPTAPAAAAPPPAPPPAPSFGRGVAVGAVVGVLSGLVALVAAGGAIAHAVRGALGLL
jgi:hypothetical protein